MRSGARHVASGWVRGYSSIVVSRLFIAVVLAGALASCGARRDYLRERQQGMREAVVTLVPETARAGLRLSDAELARETFVEGEPLAAIHSAIAPQMPAAAGCVLAPGSAWASFRVDGSAAPLDVRAADVGAKDARLDCVEEAVRRWTLPKDPFARGLVVVQVYGTAPRNVATDTPGVHEEGRPVDPAATRRAMAKDPQCVAQGVSRHRGLVARATAGNVVARFAVAANGRVSDVHFLTPTLLPVAYAVKSAIEACEWTPGALNGKATRTWVVLPVRFQGE